jgi:hypothetical protein
MTPQRVAARWIDGEAPAAPFAYVARPASDPPIGGVLLLHEAFGLNADIQAMAGSCLLYKSPSPRDSTSYLMPSSA